MENLKLICVDLNYLLCPHTDSLDTTCNVVNGDCIQAFRDVTKLCANRVARCKAWYCCTAVLIVDIALIGSTIKTATMQEIKLIDFNVPVVFHLYCIHKYN